MKKILKEFKEIYGVIANTYIKLKIHSVVNILSYSKANFELKTEEIQRNII